MSKDPSDKEQEFINGLTVDTGKDLAAWMAAIDRQTFAHRNDMIDWLRQQGLTFSRASRLERLHHNGGRPLYDLKPTRDDTVARHHHQAEPVPLAPSAPPAVVVPPLPAPKSLVNAAYPAQSLETILVKAKGYRPLAELVLREFRRSVPHLTFEVREAVAYIGAPAPFAAFTATAKDVRLALDLGERAFDDVVKQGRLAGTPAHFSHLVVLNDARKVDATLIALFNEARLRTNG